MEKIFSSEELITLHNKNFFYVKASVTKKIDELLAEVRDELKSEIQKRKIIFPKEVDVRTGKIFRGENYLGLPYLVLDYPKYFSKHSVCSFRTMFWWGNFFSFTMHLQGKALSKYKAKLIRNKNKLRNKNIFICVNASPWQYHYEKDNYILIDKISSKELKNILSKKEFIKLSRKISLKDYKKLSGFVKESFRMMANTLR